MGKTGLLNTVLIIDFEQAKEVYVKYTVIQTGTRNLSAEEKGFPLELVIMEYSTDGGSITSIPAVLTSLLL